jgi:uncharacterized protein (DUF1330 family)
MIPYQQRVQETMATFGGGYRTLIRHRVTALEGDVQPHKGVVILEFPTYQQAWDWYHSDEYAPLLALRLQHMRCDTVLVDGLAEGEPVRTGRLDEWELEQLAKFEARQSDAG